jgi:hypothetical protein
LLRCRRRRHLEISELGDEELHRLRLGPFVDAVEGLALPAAEEPGHGLVGHDHHLLERGMGERLASIQARSTSALVVERENVVAGLDAECTTRVAPPRSSVATRSPSRSASVTPPRTRSVPARIACAWE